MENASINSVYFSAEDIVHSNELIFLGEYQDGNENESGLQNETHTKLQEEEILLILVSKAENHEDHELKRRYFEKSLLSSGLILSHEKDEHLNFVKIGAPKNVLCHFCEILKMRMPMKKIPGLNVKFSVNTKNFFKRTANRISNLIANTFEISYFNDYHKWTAEFSMSRQYLFDINSTNFFSSSDQNLIINFILERGKFSENIQDIGIKKLLEEQIYIAYYPMHDGNLNSRGSQRQFFYKEWASISKFYKLQPIDEIKNYFGVKFSLYFVWLGFYTKMLIPASIIGIICMVNGFFTLSSNKYVQEICDNDSNIMMCPKCDRFCDYWSISDACTYAKITHIFDNNSTLFFGIFMSIWSALFVELWKRHSAEIAHRWGLSNFDLDTQHPRPEYLARLTHFKKKINVVTNLEEPVVPFFKVKLPAMVLSFSFALLWIFLAVAAVFAVVIYRMAGIATDILFDNSNTMTTFVVPITASVINLICITLLNYVYEKVAIMLTKYEYHRTQIEFDDSLTLKIYMFQFVNFYSSLFYIAFLKGKFVGYPAKYNRILGFRQEECSLGGCMMELFMQLAIIMIGKQALNSVIEQAIPKLRNIRKKSLAPNLKSHSKQWVSDYYLMEWDTKGMFSEYLEMVIQYGFLTLFVVAFPLAPLFALINNVFELRLDAKKYVKFYRQPITQSAKNIGIWLYIIKALGKIAIVSNAFIIAFSSNYIHQMVYYAYESKNNSTSYSDNEGLLNWTLAYFNVKDFQAESRPLNTKFLNLTECRYAEYRNPYWESNKYKRNPTFWHVLAAKLAFIVVYQNFVGVIVLLVQWTIPDVPKKLSEQIKREALRTSDYVIEQEALKTKARSN